ncbi:hypothetical protein LXA43DRAFT_901747 [Ganoderma leucocontextum]|nr:hypothetical protein LXA43DRAFT_901747 [Ganoderma leucocontextum]
MGTMADLHRRNKLREDNADVQWRITTARRWIFEDGTPLTSVWLKHTLGPLSLTPTRNAFSTQLADKGFNFYSLYAPDQMHEFELGVWKSALMHLVRLLHAFGGDKVQTFNEQFRRIPTFGRSTIRRFVNNMADLKKMAAHDFEDSLRCAPPVFDGLPPEDEDNKIILDLLFDYGCWHALSKLRLQTDDTNGLLNAVTVESGVSVHKFKRVTCARYVTYELPKESAARGRRTAVLASQGKGKGSAGGRKVKEFSTTTYKYHAIWDYASTIPMFRPSDVWSTLYGELEHKVVKGFYARTNKNDHAGQIARHVHLQGKLNRLASRVHDSHEARKSRARPRDHRKKHRSPEHAGNPADQYAIAESQRHYDNLIEFVHEHQNDPVYESFISRLRAHILSRMEGFEFDGVDPEYGRDQCDGVNFVSNRIYHHHTLRVNYTTYDMQRPQDVTNPNSHPDIMVLAHEDNDIEDPHPFIPFHTGGTFGFLDPFLVIRSSHMCPIFRHGYTDELLGKSGARDGQNHYEKEEHHNEDYRYYLVNMFVNHDMFMRYLGGGAGHMGVGTKIAVAFDNEDFEWQDVDSEIEELPDDDDNAVVMSSEEDVARLACGNG